MVITTTGIAFILSSLGLAFCGLHFFKAFKNISTKQDHSRIGFLLSSHLIASASVLGILGLGSLIFAKNPEALYYILLISHFPLIIGASIGIYLIYYIFFPRISPRFTVAIAVLLGITIIASTVITHPLPFLNASGSIDWNMSRWLSVLLSYLVFLQIGSTLYIFYKLIFFAPSRMVRNFSLFIAIFSFFALVNHLIRFTFFAIESADLRTRIYDLVLAFIGISFIIGFLIFPFIRTRISRFSKNHLGEDGDIPEIK